MKIVNKPSVLTIGMNSAVQLKLKCLISVPLLSPSAKKYIITVFGQVSPSCIVPKLTIG